MTIRTSTLRIATLTRNSRRADVPMAALFAAAFLTVMTGCGLTPGTAVNSTQQGAVIGGTVHGGQQPVVGAVIQLYAAQASGYGAAAVPLISTTVTTDATGSFNITGDYTCPASPNDQVFLTATGGNTGGGTNSNFSEISALGPCSSLTPSSYYVINEVTTVAAAYALSGFMTDKTHIGTSSTNYLGLQHAFATVKNMVDINAGAALAVTPAYVTAPTGTGSSTFRSVVPQAEINTLANILAACVNTNGVGGSSTLCSQLFSATTVAGHAPTDVVGAALAIAQNPGLNVTTLYNLSSSSVPFSPTLSTAPSDWTIALNYTGGGLGGPAAGTPVVDTAASNQAAIDANGNIWVADFRNSRITELDYLGAPLSPNTILTPSIVVGGYNGGGFISNPNGITVDLSGNAWVANNNGTLAEVSSNGSAVGSGFSGGGLSGTVKGIATDGNNNVWAVSGNAISKFNNAGVDQSGGNGYTANVSSVTGAMAFDASENLWMVSGGNKETLEFSNAGSLLNVSNPVNDAAGGFGAIDQSGRFLAPNGSPDNDIEIFNTNATLYLQYMTSSVSNPTGVAVDGLGNIFTVQYGGGSCGTSCTVPANVSELDKNYNLLSPTNTGYVGTGTGLLSKPQGLAIDMAGNLWVVNSTNLSSLTEFVGLAAPTVVPLPLAVKNNAIATRP